LALARLTELGRSSGKIPNKLLATLVDDLTVKKDKEDLKAKIFFPLPTAVTSTAAAAAAKGKKLMGF